MKLLLAAIFCAFGLLACSSDDGASTSASATATPRLESTAPVVMSTLPVLPTATTAAPAPTATVAAPPPATATTAPPPPAQPTTPPQPTAPPAPQGAPSPVTFTVTAKNLAFSTKQLTARSGAAVTVSFTNEDTSVAHDLSFSIAGLNHGNTCLGPCKDTYTFTAPAPGTYPFFCTVHADMVGSFVVTP